MDDHSADDERPRMLPGGNRTVITAIRTLLAVTVTAALVVGAFNLLRSLPWGGFFPVFWDDAAVMQAAQRDDFISGAGEGLPDYALAKFAYSTLVWLGYRAIGWDAPVYYVGGLFGRPLPDTTGMGAGP